MGHRTIAQFANRIKRVLPPVHVNDLGRQIGFCHRERLMIPYRLMLSLWQVIPWDPSRHWPNDSLMAGETGL